MPGLPSRYRIDGKLGEGGFGRVYAGRDTILDRDVAIKVLARRSGEDSRRLHQELSALRLLDLPGAVRLLDSGETESCSWIVMDRVAGAPFPGRRAPLEWTVLAATAVELLRALARIHRSGFVHGDLKPPNVLVRADGSPVILDMGLARAGLESPSSESADAFAGTPLFMAPEQLRGAPSDARSDLFAVGLMIWRALTDEWPHGPQTAREAIEARLDRAPPPIGGRLPGLPSAIASVVDSLVAREPARRPASALDVVRALTRGADPIALPADSSGPGDLTALFSGTERLLHHPSDAARVTWDRAGGEPARAGNVLDVWLALGIVRRSKRKLEIDRSDLDRLIAGWAPESERGGAAPASVPGSPFALSEWIAAHDDARIGHAALAAAETERGRGSLASAFACLYEGLRACWRSGDSDVEGRLVAAVVDLALSDPSIKALDTATEMIGRSRVRDDGGLALLGAARMLQDGRPTRRSTSCGPCRPPLSSTPNAGVSS